MGAPNMGIFLPIWVYFSQYGYMFSNMGFFFSNMGLMSHIGVNMGYFLQTGANMGSYIPNMGYFLFADISNVAVDILTLSYDDSLLSLNVNIYTGIYAALSTQK